MSEEDPAILLARAERLTCCLVFEGPDRRTSAGGSAIFIAPGLALTARHVTDEGFNFLGERRSTKVGPAEMSEHGMRLFQQSFDGSPPFGLWSPCHEWRTETTDISLLLVPNEQSCSDSTLPMPKDFLSWSLMPPPVGERVRLLGYPLSSGSYEGNSLVCTAHPTPLEATVTAVYSPWRQRVKYDFPCFEIDVDVNQGFSGGGVFWEGRLCGIVSGGSFGTHTLVASLWPLCMMAVGDVRVNGLSGMDAVLDSGFIHASDWAAAKGRIGLVPTPSGRTYAVLRGDPFPPPEE